MIQELLLYARSSCDQINSGLVCPSSRTYMIFDFERSRSVLQPSCISLPVRLLVYVYATECFLKTKQKFLLISRDEALYELNTALKLGHFDVLCGQIHHIK